MVAELSDCEKSGNHILFRLTITFMHHSLYSQCVSRSTPFERNFEQLMFSNHSSVARCTHRTFRRDGLASNLLLGRLTHPVPWVTIAYQIAIGAVRRA